MAMITYKNNYFCRYRGWITAALIAIALSVVLQNRGVRYISKEYLIDLVRKHEISGIAIVEDKTVVRSKYVAQVTLTPVGLKKYEKYIGNSPEENIHFMVAVGYTREDVDKWRRDVLIENKGDLKFIVN